MQNQRRHLAAILFTDIVGYTAMMQQDETKAVSVTRRYLSVLKKNVSEFNGEILNDYGDGSLCSFPSATDGVNCAIHIQSELREEPSVPLRIGLHIGEIFFEDDKVYGDGVNVASRIQSLGQPNMILFSSEINNKVRNNPEFKTVSVGLFEFKNVDEPVEVFALTGKGLIVPKKEEMAGKLKATKTDPSSKKVLIFFLTIILLAAGFFIYKMLSVDAGSDHKEKTIAILPFKNISINKEENEPFCVGVVMELQKKLEWISGLTIIAPQSMEKYRDTRLAVADIANELGGIRYIIQGNVQRDKNKIKVFASLVDVANGEAIWNEDYPGEMDDIFSLQENIAEQIATALQVKISPEEKSHIERISTKNTKALDAYNEALNSYVSLTYSFHSTWAGEISSNEKLYTDYKKILAQCDQIIELDSNMSEAYVLKAKTYHYKYDNFRSRGNLADTILSLCTKALSLNEYDADVYVILANVRFRGAPSSDQLANKRYRDSSKALLIKALAINPNNFEANWKLASFYTWREFDPEKSIRYFKRALRIDPLSVWTPMVYRDFSGPYWNMLEYERAEYYLRKSIATSPNSFAAAHSLFTLGTINLQLNRPDSVFKYANQLLAMNDKNALYQLAEAYCNLKNDCRKAAELYKELWDKYHDHSNEHRWAIALYKSGNKKLADSLFEKAFAWHRVNLPVSYDLAGLYAYKGDRENALKILRDFEWQWGSPNLAKLDPLFEKIRNDKEFKIILQKAFDERSIWRERTRKMEEAGNL